MKKLLLLFITSVFFVSHYNSQTYLSLPDSGGIWVNAHYNWVWTPGVPLPTAVLSGTKTYCSNGSDTSINSTLYAKLMDCNTGSYKGAFRNSSGKVYYVPDDSLQEFLLYDFTVTTAGDTLYNVYYEDFSGQSAYLTNIVVFPNNVDSVLIGSSWRKRIHTQASDWIEGIGNTFGLLLESSPNVSNYMLELNCMSMHDTILYPAYGAGSCDITFYEKELNAFRFSVYPNPVNDNFVIEFPESVSAQVYLYNITGQKISTTLLNNNKQADINLGGLPSGIYSIICIDNNKITTRKIVKE